MFDFRHREHLSEEEFFQIYSMMAENTIDSRTIWYDGGTPKFEDWAKFVDEWCWLVRVNKGQNLLGVFWLNDFRNRTAESHFFIDKKSRKMAVDIIRGSVAFLKNETSLESIYGITPKPFRHVFSVIQQAGFRILGELQGACWMERRKKFVTGILSVYNFGG